MTQPMLPNPSQPPAGWYPSDIQGQERWWDGYQWTDAYRSAPQQALGYPGPGTQGAQQPVQYGGAMMAATDQRTNAAEVVIAWVLTLVSLGYLLPWAIAASRGKSNSLAIGIINLLAGWTVIGWIVALVMACGAHQQRTAVVQMVNVQYPPQR